MNSRVLVGLLIIALWAAGVVLNLVAGNWVGAIISGLFLLAAVMIVGALYSRSRKSMYPK